MAFDADWLALREPADLAGRAGVLLREAREHLGDGLAVDLGAGTGATARAFACGARWRLVDRDKGLLALAAERVGRAEIAAQDLRDIAALPLQGARLVTASALFDLVSEAWTEALADRLATEGLGLYAALSYDGAMCWSPAFGQDAAITAAFNAHQRGDKGFGPALGPDAGPAIAHAFVRRGYSVRLVPSPWQLGPEQAELHGRLVDGIAVAVDAPGWGQARRAASGTSACTVGHWDVLAIPGAPSAQSKITSVSSP